MKTVDRNAGKYTVVGRVPTVKEKKREKMQEIEWRGGKVVGQRLTLQQKRREKKSLFRQKKNHYKMRQRKGKQ